MDAGYGANQHVLRIAGNGGDASDVGGSGNGEQVRKRRQTHFVCQLENKWNHHETDDVIDQECREDTGCKDDSREKRPGRQVLEHCLSIYSKKPARCSPPTMTIMENKRTTVGKSIRRRASPAGTIRKATIATAPIIAAAGRSIFKPGNFPTAKTEIASAEDYVKQRRCSRQERGLKRYLHSKCEKNTFHRSRTKLPTDRQLVLKLRGSRIGKPNT